MVSDCCKSGFRWNGTPTGTESTLAGTKAYVTGNNKDVAILLVHDIFGWTFNNLRLLADHFAEEAGATVYIPDFFDGEIVTEETMVNPELREKFDLMGFIGRHNKEIRYPQILAAAKALKAEYSKTGAIGYCYGGWAVFKLGSDPSIVDAVSGVHPSIVEPAELDALKVPTQILAPEHDFSFTPDLKAHANTVIPTLGVPYEYVYFPGLQHGFAGRGDQNDKAQVAGLERAKNSAVGFFKEFLH
ncbi:alpha/beta-hydrolase [Massarina eburnea CBS 473.64]|uniref:Alpha/beta-hydrolase n=1 Tax=Massarina eburnea CBS 473.64 TaxID=1395130 RepID=A0A6A6S5I9_9PLEO|nr:alpha/beta-hydrolase [Massarina eburnea CBS 473.64]